MLSMIVWSTQVRKADQIRPLEHSNGIQSLIKDISTGSEYFKLSQRL